jgi:hypothetical protein
MARPWYTHIDSLRVAGVTGFLTIRELRACKLACVPGKGGEIGVYVVLRIEDGGPSFLPASTGGRFKGRDPNVAIDVLQAKWIHDSQIVYIGKAGAPGKSATLRSRLKQYLDFGAGRPVGHWGGRYIWHLPNSENLVVCWKLTPGGVPRDIEQQMIREFAARFGGRPFANLTD